MIDLASSLRRARASRARRGASGRILALMLLNVLLMFLLLMFLLRSHGAWGIGGSILLHSSAVVALPSK